LIHRIRVLRRELRLALRDIRTALRACRHPLAVAVARVRAVRPFPIGLRSGIRVTGPDGRTLLPLIDEVFLERVYERFGIAVRPGDTVVDIGAHVGVFSLYAAQRGAARIVAFEPAGENAVLLRANVSANNAERISVHDAAVTGVDGTAHLLPGRESVGGRVRESTRGRPDGPGDAIGVKALSLQSAIEMEGLDFVDFLKIDCEGSEGAIFESAPPSVLERVRAIVLEYHDAWSSLSGQELACLLEERGFRVRWQASPEVGFGMIYACRSSEVMQ
jgi:FkbM family methyltransferase